MAFVSPSVMSSFGALLGGNHSGTGTPVQSEWFPDLDTCTAMPGCIGPKGAIFNALDDLKARLGDANLSALAQSQIFDKLGTDASGNNATTKGFLGYLSKERPLLFNGVTSTYCVDSIDSNNHCYQNSYLRFFLNGISVKDAFQKNPKTDAMTRTPGTPLLVFLRPSAILYPNLGRSLGNEGMLFHEALHGYTGQYDGATILRPQGILEKLGYNSSQDPSCKITQYIQDNVLSQSSGLDPTKIPCT